MQVLFMAVGDASAQTELAAQRSKPCVSQTAFTARIGAPVEVGAVSVSLSVLTTGVLLLPPRSVTVRRTRFTMSVNASVWSERKKNFPSPAATSTALLKLATG